MKIDEQTAVVDNDFTNHLAEAHLDDDQLVELLHTLFSDLDIMFAIHPLVYQYELRQDLPRIRLLFDRGVVAKAEFADIHQNDDGKKAYYTYLVENLYRAISGDALPASLSDESLFTCWMSRSSLGEVHSVATCLTCGCGIFLSDDNDSKMLQRFIAEKSIGKISVYNRKELVDMHLDQGGTKLPRKVRQSLTHRP